MKILLSILVTIPSLAVAFTVARQSAPFIRSQHVKLYAESAVPHYDKLDAKLSRVELFGEGTAMLHIETDDVVDYRAGHVIALEIKGNASEQDDKNSNDAANNGGWMRGPYTISRCSSPNAFDVLIRIVGEKSETFAAAKPGTPLKFGGPFRVPIIEGIDKQNTKRVVLISTGVGVGPCIGAIEEAMKDESFPPIELCASFRNKSDIVYAEYIDSLDVKFKPIITSEMGRISSTEENVGIILPDAESNLSLNDTHYHLIGNGQMVNEWKEGLSKAGVPEEKVTVEWYFNNKAAPDVGAISNIANVVSQTGVPRIHKVEETSTITNISKEKLFGILVDVRTVDKWNPLVNFVDYLYEVDSYSGLGAHRRCNFFDGSSVVETCMECSDSTVRFEVTKYSFPVNSLFLYFKVMEPAQISGEADAADLTIGVDFEPNGEDMTDKLRHGYNEMFKMLFQGIQSYSDKIAEKYVGDD